MTKKTVYIWALTGAMCWNINASSELTSPTAADDVDAVDTAAQEAVVSSPASNSTQESQSAGEASEADEGDINEELSRLVKAIQSNLTVNPHLGDDVSEVDDVPVRGGPGSEQRRGRDRNREVNVDDVARVVSEMQAAATTDEGESMPSGTDEESVVEGEAATQEESNLITRREQNDDSYPDDFDE